ncbi:hypothetical protein COOONC_14384 [Cooperia oncophora]
MKATTLGGVRIQEGENVCADTLTIHFNRELLGDDADDFRPERAAELSQPQTETDGSSRQQIRHSLPLLHDGQPITNNLCSDYQNKA